MNEIERNLDPSSSSESGASTNPTSGDWATAHVAGWLAHQFRVQYPELTKGKTSEFYFEKILKEKDTAWTSCLSKGGLSLPSDEFLAQVKVMESTFKQFHNEPITGIDKVMESLVFALKEALPNTPVPILKKFSVLRTHKLLKDINDEFGLSKKKAQSRNKEKIKHFTT